MVVISKPQIITAGMPTSVVHLGDMFGQISGMDVKKVIDVT